MSSWALLFWSMRWEAVAWKPLNWSRNVITARRASSSSKTPACADVAASKPPETAASHNRVDARAFMKTYP
ncbi:hypothetical protein D3C87_1018920 [compost metagenome]